MHDTLSPQQIAGLASDAGLSIEELCKRAGIHRTTFSRWREGKHTPGLAVYQRIIDALKSGEQAA